MNKNGKVNTVKVGTSSADFYLKSIRKSKSLTAEKEYELWCCMCQGSEEARKALILGNMHYVIGIANKYVSSKVLLEDLIQAGTEGLIKAVDRYDGNLGCRLISYAKWYIRNEVNKAAHSYIDYDYESFDDVFIPNTEESPKYSSMSADWNLRYIDKFNDIKTRMEDRLHGIGPLAEALIQTLVEGGDTDEFASRHHLSECHMNRLLAILREEARHTFPYAA